MNAQVTSLMRRSAVRSGAAAMAIADFGRLLRPQAARSDAVLISAAAPSGRWRRITSSRSPP
jgi:hypothetical protein